MLIKGKFFYFQKLISYFFREGAKFHDIWIDGYEIREKKEKLVKSQNIFHYFSI